MPTYDYRCAMCGHCMEVFQNMKEAALTDCPVCKEPALRRLIGAGAGLLFKGTGFYLTDYKRTGGSTDTSAASGDGKKTSTETAAPAPATKESGGRN